MKPYGLPREASHRYLDCGDIREFARASACCCYRHTNKHGGPCRSHFKNAAEKRATRRLFKKSARRAAKADLIRRLADA